MPLSAGALDKIVGEMNAEEMGHLDALESTADYDHGLNQLMVHKSAEIFLRWSRGASVLELGPAEGIGTPHLATVFDDVTHVESSQQLAENLAHRMQNVTVHHALFEDCPPIDNSTRP